MNRFYLLAIIFIAACGDDPTGPSADDLEGFWSGETDQGGNVFFTVEDGRIGVATIEGSVTGSVCTYDFTISTTVDAPIRAGKFDVESFAIDPAIEAIGTFTSASRASGTLVFRSDECGGTSTTTWTATKESSSTRPTLSGTWEGTFTSDQFSQPFGFTMTLVESGSRVEGTFSTQNSARGDVEGTITGRTVEFVFTLTLAHCPGIWEATLTVLPGSLSGEWTGEDCIGSHLGTMDLSRS